jgi:Uma2 family endonuclease
MVTSTRFTSADLEVMPDDGKRYEIIDGDLFVSKQPDWNHQGVCDNVVTVLNEWGLETKLGSVRAAPGVIFAEDDDVAPDAVWISSARLARMLGTDGHLHGPPELIVEALSAGRSNERRDREAKLKLYSRRGVDEYWIIDWRTRTIDIHRRDGDLLRLVLTLREEDTLSSPVLPGFSVPVARIFAGL